MNLISDLDPVKMETAIATAVNSPKLKVGRNQNHSTKMDSDTKPRVADASSESVSIGVHPW